MPTIHQRHKDRLATLDSQFLEFGVTHRYIPFGNNVDGSLMGSANLIFDSIGNVLTVGGRIASTTITVGSSATFGSIAVTGTANITGATTISSNLTVAGNEYLQGTLTTGSNSIAATNPQGYVNVTALSPGPVGTWLTTGTGGVVNWNSIPNIAAGWTFDGAKIYSNAGIPVRVNSLSTGSEMLNVGGTSIFQNTLSVTNGGISVVGTGTFHSGISLTGALSTASNGVGLPGQALFTNGSNATYWSYVGGGFVRGSAAINSYAPGGFPGGINNYTLQPITFAALSEVIDANPDFVSDFTHGLGNSRHYINYSTRAFTGDEFNTGAALNVVDSGGGCINCGFGSIGIRLNATPPGYAGPALNGGFINMDSNSPEANLYYFLVCQNQDGNGGTTTVKASIDSTGACYFKGGGSFKNTVGITGNLNVSGTLTAGTKHFAIPHPLPELAEKKKLFHSSVESARPDLIYRGRIKVIGEKTIDLDVVNRMTPGTLEALADMENADVFLTNRSNFANVRASLSGSKLCITCDSEFETEVAWMVVTERLATTMPDAPIGPDGRFIIERDV